MKYVKLSSVTREVIIEVGFVSTWCIGEVVCKGGFSHL